MTSYQKKFIKNMVQENRNYKIVALLVSLVLWVTILGRKDLVFSKEVDLQLLLAPNLSVVNRVKDKVTVKVKGSRTSLKKFMQNSEALTLDLADINVGWSDVKISKNDMSLPIGVQIIEIRPKSIKVRIKKVIIKETE